jgi:Ca-activated chloride channel family protein
MHPSPRHPTRFFTPGQARALTLATALVLGLALGCTQAPDPGAATSSAAPPPRELPAPLASEDQGQITQIPRDQAPGAPAKQEATSNIRYAYPTLLPERSIGAPLPVVPRANIAQQDAYAFPPPPPPPVPEDRERYAKLTDNGVFLTQEQPVSTFSIDVDTGSYANVRRFLNQGQCKRPGNYRIAPFCFRSSIFKLCGSSAANASGDLAPGRCSKRWLR